MARGRSGSCAPDNAAPCKFADEARTVAEDPKPYGLLPFPDTVRNQSRENGSEEHSGDPPTGVKKI